MRVLCVGAGAIGSLVGGRLALCGHDVTLLARRDHVAAIRTRGLTLETPGERLICKRIDSVTSIDDLASPPDLVLFTVKSYDTPEALRTARSALGDRAPVLSLQNGVGNEEAIASALGASRTLAGTLTISASRPRPGVVRQHTAVGGIGVASVDPSGDPSSWVRTFRDAGIPARAYRDYRAMKWSKLLVNLFTNATSAILDLPPVEIVDNPRLFDLEREAQREALAVIRRSGLRLVPLPGYPVPALRMALAAPPWLLRPVFRRLVRRGRGEARTSLWFDLHRGKPTNEVAVLNGAVVREATRLGLRAPVNAVLAGVLGDLAAGRVAAAEFRGRPEALLAAVASRRAS